MSNERLTTPACRCSYPHLAKPHGMPGETDPEKMKFSIDILLDRKNKEHMAYLKKLKVLAKATAVERFGAKLPKVFAWPFKDGDDKDSEDLAGMTIFTAKAGRSYRPKVFDNSLQVMDDMVIDQEVYSGCVVRASVNCYAWEFAGKKGVSIGLKSVKKVRDDEAFGGAGTAADFAAFSEEDADEALSDFNPETAEADDDLGDDMAGLDGDDDDDLTL